MDPKMVTSAFEQISRAYGEAHARLAASEAVCAKQADEVVRLRKLVAERDKEIDGLKRQLDAELPRLAREIDGWKAKHAKAESEVATTAEVQTATDTARAVVPSAMASHPGVSKTWIELDASSGTPTATKSRNVSSITDNGTGDFTIVITDDFDSGNYVRAASCMVNITTGGFIFGPFTTTPAAGSCRFICTTAAFAAADCKYVSVAFLGTW